MIEKSTSTKGFTLVELAIVMVVIGLLIGGILKGSELITTAKVNRTIKDLKGYESALVLFRDKYNGLPGDLMYATARIPDCNTQNHCTNGDGNGIIAASDWVDSDLTTWGTRLATLPGPIPREATQLWKHLSLGNIISGVDPSANPGTPEWGRSHPSSPFGGGYEMYFDGWTTIGGNQNIIRLSRVGIFTGPWQNLLSPSITAMIDRKIDDGNPNTGYVVVNYGIDIDTCRAYSGGTIIYNEENSGAECTLFYAVPK